MSNILDSTQTTQTSVSFLKALLNWRILIPAAVIEHAPLEAVYIFFDTATYDQIERDVKVGDY